MTVVIFEIEHIVPLSATGATSIENLCLACPTCNRHKSIRQQAIDPQTGKQFPLFHPQKDQWYDHFRWDNSTTQLVGLTAIGRTTIAALKMNRPQLIRVRTMWVKLGEHP